MSWCLTAHRSRCQRWPSDHQFSSFEETLGILEIKDGKLLDGEKVADLTQESSIYRALCLGVQDYIGKNHFPGVLLGLSGGIDSALTLAVAVDALGADKVRAVDDAIALHGANKQRHAREMAKIVGVHYDELDIQPTFTALLDTLDPLFHGLPADTTEEICRRASAEHC